MGRLITYGGPRCNAGFNFDVARPTGHRGHDESMPADAPFAGGGPAQLDDLLRSPEDLVFILSLEAAGVFSDGDTGRLTLLRRDAAR